MDEVRRSFQRRMTEAGAHIRERRRAEEALRAEEQYEMLRSGEVSLECKADLLRYFQNRQLCLTHLAVLKSIVAYLRAVVKSSLLPGG